MVPPLTHIRVYEWYPPLIHIRVYEWCQPLTHIRVYEWYPPYEKYIKFCPTKENENTCCKPFFELNSGYLSSSTHPTPRSGTWQQIAE
jgi:hypothetical protein